MKLRLKLMFFKLIILKGQKVTDITLGLGKVGVLLLGKFFTVCEI